MKKILVIAILVSVMLTAEAITKDKSFVIDCKTETLELSGVGVIQNKSNEDILYSKEEFSTENFGFTMRNGDMVLFNNATLFVKCWGHYGKGLINVSPGGY